MLNGSERRRKKQHLSMLKCSRFGFEVEDETCGGDSAGNDRAGSSSSGRTSTGGLTRVSGDVEGAEEAVAAGSDASADDTEAYDRASDDETVHVEVPLVWHSDWAAWRAYFT
ncbi:uncharacterized protein PITG_04921 [Phytophthora infestans T30-4]|uniref:Uncharacterized protein n=1 Tax=Phytophthora infestans (strain T30-4) TaxID=403677 RepID=D0N2D5_PHYIT|nr:uncharacterized protein PITG_04921 [Phytophthora infestans T30-4]EEY68464.1 hypothetical protein PITG_04921 [Phytophthora infestans T30-4]|eukprot:XP_002905623.1 hypothetical protein PITG_04921 [Phytophthora infestans T30-4]